MVDIYEIKGEEALDVLADILEPACEIMTDEEVSSELQSGSKIRGITLILKNHKQSIISIMARLNGENPKTYEPNLVALPKMLLEIFSNPEVQSLFISQSQSKEETPFGSAMETTEAQKK